MCKSFPKQEVQRPEPELRGNLDPQPGVPGVCSEKRGTGPAERKGRQ